MKSRHRIVPCEMKVASEDGWEFEGFAGGFHNIDTYGEIIAPGFFEKGLPRFLQEGFVGGINHDWDKPTGKPLLAREEARGLFTRARISDTTYGRDVKTLIADGVIKKLSIGFRTTSYKWLDSAEEVFAYWSEHNYTPSSQDVSRSQYGALLLLEGELYEYSPVTLPANDMCDITGVKADPPAGVRFDDHFLRVLATNEEFMTRIQGLSDTRAADDRQLAPAHRAKLKSLRDHIELLLDKTDRHKGQRRARAAYAKALEHEADLLFASQ